MDLSVVFSFIPNLRIKQNKFSYLNNMIFEQRINRLRRNSLRVKRWESDSLQEVKKPMLRG